MHFFLVACDVISPQYLIWGTIPVDTCVPRGLIQLVSWLLILALAPAAFANEAMGILTASGNVLVDNQPYRAGTSVFAGDRIETLDKAGAAVTQQGTIISLMPLSSVTLGKILQFHAGSMVVTSSTGVITKVADVAIVTTPGAIAKFVASRTRDELDVTVLQGSVYVADGQKETPVPPGQGVKILLDPNPANPQSHDKRRGVGWLRNDDVGAIIVFSSAVAAGVALGLYNAQNALAATPVRPGP